MDCLAMFTMCIVGREITMHNEIIDNALTRIRQREVTWYPSDSELELIENFGFIGLTDPKEMASILGVKVSEFTHSGVMVPSILERFNLGKARAHFATKSALMMMISGDMEISRFPAVRYALQSRFGSDEHAAANLQALSLSLRKLKLEEDKVMIAKRAFNHSRKVHSDRIDLETTKMTLGLSTDELNAVTKGDNEL